MSDSPKFIVTYENPPDYDLRKEQLIKCIESVRKEYELRISPYVKMLEHLEAQRIPKYFVHMEDYKNLVNPDK